MPFTPSRTFSISGVSKPTLRERAVERVEHGEELLHEPLGGAVDERGLLAQHALAVVLEVGLHTTQRVDELAPLALELREIGLDDGRGGVRRGVVVDQLTVDDVVVERRHAVSSPGSSTISASATSSSFGAEAPGSPAPPAAWLACAAA